MGKSIILLADNYPGHEVIKFLRNRGDKILLLYLHSRKFRKMGKEIISASGLPKSKIFTEERLQDPRHIEMIKKLHPDFIVTVFWRKLLPEKILQSARLGTVNFHPALLPIGRGWYPHVHSIIKGYKAGVTLHQMDATADTGPILAQKEVFIEPHETSKDVYDKLQKEIVLLFKNTWPKIAQGKIRPLPQDNTKTVYFPKRSVDAFDKLEMDKKMSVREVINILRARSFGNKGFAYFDEGGKKIYVNLRLSKKSNFD